MYVFSTYLPFFNSNFDRESSLDVELNSASNEYPFSILLTDPATPKNKKYLKKLNSASNEYPLGILLTDPATPKNKKYLKKWNDDVIIPFFQVFLVFGVAGSVKSMPSGYALDAEFNSASNELSLSKFE